MGRFSGIPLVGLKPRGKEKRKFSRQLLNIYLSRLFQVFVAWIACLFSLLLQPSGSLRNQQLSSKPLISSPSPLSSPFPLPLPFSPSLPSLPSLSPLLLSPPVEMAAATESAAQLFRQADRRKLHKERYWLLLLHYRDGESEADGESFFFAAQGKSDPREEMRATLEALLEPAEKYSRNQHPQCRFPARYNWLKRQLPFDVAERRQVDCPALQLWLEIVSPRYISAVFASYYLNAPASMFGHTLLKIGSERYRDSSLLDYAVNFAAYPNYSDPIRYALYGLLGGFPGRFAFLPYHAKVREYNDMESRDLWEYRLNLSRPEMKRMLLHLWELDQTHFDYFYVDENCSYHLLSLLEVARPRLDLRRRFTLFTVPGETLRLLFEEGLLEEAHYRPSLYSTVKGRIDSLSPQERALFFAVLKQRGKFIEEADRREIAPERRIFLLDTLLTAVRFQIEREGQPDSSDAPVIEGNSDSQEDSSTTEEAFYQQLIRLRTALPPTAQKYSPQVADLPPHLSHKPALLAPLAGLSNYGAFLGVRWRPLFHDLLAVDDGYSRTSELLFLDLDLRWYREESKPQLHQLHLLRILSLSPYESYRRSFSYLVDTGIDSHFFYNRKSYSSTNSNGFNREQQVSELRHTNGIYLSVLAGLSTEFPLKALRSQILLSLLGGGRYRYIAARQPGSQLIPEALALLFWGRGRWKYGLSANYLPYSLAAGQDELQTAFHVRFSLRRNSELRSSLKQQQNYEEFLLSFLYFF